MSMVFVFLLLVFWIQQQATVLHAQRLFCQNVEVGSDQNQEEGKTKISFRRLAIASIGVISAGLRDQYNSLSITLV